MEAFDVEDEAEGKEGVEGEQGIGSRQVSGARKNWESGEEGTPERGRGRRVMFSSGVPTPSHAARLGMMWERIANS